MVKKVDSNKYTEEYIEANADIVDWYDVCRRAPVKLFSKRFLERFGCELDWEEISKNENITYKFAKKHSEKLYFVFLLQNSKHIGKIVKAYDVIPDEAWDYISKNKHLTKSFIRKHKNEVIWWSISECAKLSEPFIREFKDRVMWSNVCLCQKLSEPFMREFINKVNFNIISEKQKLSEDFISEFQYQLDWEKISFFQKLSESFIRDMEHKIVWEKYEATDGIAIFKYNPDEPAIFYSKITVIWTNIFEVQNVSEGFKEEFKHKLRSDEERKKIEDYFHGASDFRKNIIEEAII